MKQFHTSLHSEMKHKRVKQWQMTYTCRKFSSQYCKFLYLEFVQAFMSIALSKTFLLQEKEATSSTHEKVQILSPESHTN